MTYTIDYLKEHNLIIFEAISGSKAYGTNTPQSDTDIRGIFIQPLDDIYKYGFIDQVNDETNDTTYYELKRFLQLLYKNNPNIIELLNIPYDKVLIESELFKYIRENRSLFISKLCKDTFVGYAKSQISKAKGYNKKINWERDKVIRKSIIDFCYVLQDGKTIKFHKWMETQTNFISQNQFGLSKINNARDIYGMYNVSNEETYYLGHSGIYKSEFSNDVQLTSFSKEAPFVGFLVFNKDAYSQHCKDYKEYQEWVNKRNPHRYNVNKKHGKNYDSKNMMHLFRLLYTAKDIVIKNDIIVKRPDEELKFLMKIRNGDYEYDYLINEADKLIKEVTTLFDNSNLPDKPSIDFIRDLEVSIRNEFYM